MQGTECPQGLKLRPPKRLSSGANRRRATGEINVKGIAKHMRRARYTVPLQNPSTRAERSRVNSSPLISNC